VGITFGLGCDSLRCVILELRLVCLPVSGSVDRCRDVSVRTFDIGHWEIFIFIVAYQLCMGESSYSETRQRWSCVLRYHSWDGLVITTLSTVGLPESKSSHFWSRADFICIPATCRGVIRYGE